MLQRLPELLVNNSGANKGKPSVGLVAELCQEYPQIYCV